MRIVLDLQACQTESRFRGMGRYSMSLAKAIAKNAGGHEIWLFLNGLFPDAIPYIRHSFEGLIPKERIFVFSAHGPVAEIDPQNEWRTKAAELIREYALYQIKPDIVHINSLFEGYGDDAVTSIGAFDSTIPSAVTLYDLIPYVDPENSLPNEQIKKWYYRKIQSFIKANIFLAISEYSKKEAVGNLGIAEENIINISAAIDENFKPLKYSEEQKSSILSRYNIKKSFIMYSPGGFEERKNIKKLIEAYSLLSNSIKKDYQLVITGKIHEETESNLLTHAKKFNINKSELIFTGYLENDDLITMYNLCKLFVCPSLHEGFGLPPLEAMACGAPTIGSNRTSIPEVIGRQDALFDPFSAKSISDKISEVLTNEGFFNSLKEHSLKQAKKFSWDKSAKMTLEAFEVLFKKNVSIKTQPAGHGDRDYKRLISSVAKIDAKLSLTKDDFLSIAKKISQNTIADNTKQLLVDITELVQRDAKTGIQRVVRNITSVLIKNQSQGYQVRPVYFDGKCYRYADRFSIKTFRELMVDSKDEYLHDEVVEFSRNDIFLCLDLIANILPVAEDFLQKINNLGIEIYFIVYDILPVLHPEWWPIPMSTVMENWLRIVVKISTGIICISKSTEEDVKRWVSKNCHDRLKPLKINHFYLGADIKEDIMSRTEKSKSIIDNFSPFEQVNIKKILIIKLDHIGDQILALPAINLIKNHFRNVHIVGLIGEWNKDITELANIFNETIIYNFFDNERLPQHEQKLEAKLTAELKKYGFDLAIDLRRQPDTRKFLVLSEAKIKAGYKTGTELDLKIDIYLDYYPDQPQIRTNLNKTHATVQQLNLANKVIENFIPVSYLQLNFPQENIKIVENKLKSFGIDLEKRPLIGIHPGATHIAKQWGINNYVQLIKILLRDKNAQVVLFGTHEDIICDEIIESFPNKDNFISLRSKLSLKDFIIACKLFDLIIGNDNGALHCASLANVPTISIFSGRELPTEWSQFTYQSLSIYKNLECSPCHIDSIERCVNDIRCLKNITVNEVADAVNNILGKKSCDIEDFNYLRLRLNNNILDSFNIIPVNNLQEKEADPAIISKLKSNLSFLMVGTIEPRKGHMQTLAAFKRLWSEGLDINLVIVGKQGWMVEKLINILRNNSQLNNHLFWLEGISDEYLEKVYDASTCLIAASEGEGFGLPLIEAAQYKLPIIARDIRVFREVAGNYAFYFEGANSEDLAKAIKDWLNLYKEGKHPKSDNMPWLTWKQSAEQLVDIIFNDK